MNYKFSASKSFLDQQVERNPEQLSDDQIISKFNSILVVLNDPNCSRFQIFSNFMKLHQLWKDNIHDKIDLSLYDLDFSFLLKYLRDFPDLFMKSKKAFTIFCQLAIYSAELIQTIFLENSLSEFWTFSIESQYLMMFTVFQISKVEEQALSILNYNDFQIIHQLIQILDELHQKENDPLFYKISEIRDLILQTFSYLIYYGQPEQIEAILPFLLPVLMIYIQKTSNASDVIEMIRQICSNDLIPQLYDLSESQIFQYVSHYLEKDYGDITAKAADLFLLLLPENPDLFLPLIPPTFLDLIQIPKIYTNSFIQENEASKTNETNDSNETNEINKKDKSLEKMSLNLIALLAILIQYQPNLIDIILSEPLLSKLAYLCNNGSQSIKIQALFCFWNSLVYGNEDQQFFILGSPLFPALIDSIYLNDEVLILKGVLPAIQIILEELIQTKDPDKISIQIQFENVINELYELESDSLEISSFIESIMTTIPHSNHDLSEI